jgi:serine/threonine protein kinase/ABC-type branched-subunit amino acid transport system substrate-binding protein
MFVLGSFQQVEGQANTSSLILNITTPIKYVAPKYLKENATNTITLGVVAVPDPPESRFGYQLVAIKVAIDWVNSNPDILPDTAIEMYSSSSSVDSDVLLSSFYMATQLKVNGFIGAGFTTQSKEMQTVATIYGIPQMSASVVTNALSNKNNYPYFARTVCTDTTVVNGIVQFFQGNGWTQGVVIYTTDEYGGGYSTMVLAASKANITLYSQPVDATATNTAAFYKNDMDALKKLSDERGYRIFVLYTSQATTAIVQAMNISGLFGPEYVLIETGGPADGARNPSTKPNPLLDGVFGFGYGMPQGPVYDELLAYWQSKNVSQNNVASYNLWYYMDIVLAFAHAYDNLLKAGTPFASITGKTVFNQILKQNFTGVTGDVTLDSNGDRVGSYEVWNWLGNMTVPAGLVHVGHWDVLTQTYTKLNNYTFFGNSQVVPPDRPYMCPACQHGTCVEYVGCVCDPNYSGIICDVYVKNSNNKNDIIISVVVVVVVVSIILVIVAMVYRRNRRRLVRSVAEKQKSIIPRGDLVLKDRIGRGASGEVYKALFRGTEIAVKKIVTSNVSKDIIEAFELEVAVMCGLRHPNIIMFMGSCYDTTTQEMLLCMEFMGRGSLNDVIHNPNILLSYEMKLHLATQAAQGMNFLHMSSPPIIHHDLKSHNILLDDKWNARISDFGIAKLKEESRTVRSEGGAVGHSIGTIYWTAPEALDGQDATEKADCYSFGIVLWEVFHRQMPYRGRDPVSVAVDVVKNGLRPPISADVPNEVQDIIRACWAQSPLDRPSFQDIMTSLRTLSLQAPLHNYGGNVRVDAPNGRVFIVVTNIQGAYALWGDLPREMEEAVKLHNTVIRHNLDLYKGYEASFVNHSFTAAFAVLEDALNFAIAVQVSLLHVEWPPALLATDSGKEVRDSNNNVVWKGLQVRIAIGAGVPNCEIDASSGRMNYFGGPMDKIRRMLDLACDGSVLLQDSVATEMPRKARLVQEAFTEKVGDMVGTARAKEDIHQLIIKSLASRTSTKSESYDDDITPSGAALPHMVIPMDDLEDLTSDSTNRPTPAPPSLENKVSWLAHSSDIEQRELIGKGPIGDYFRGNWKGRDVAIKVLVNQKLKEEDLLKLIGDSAYMSKLNHPNILPFYAVCMEPGRLSIISEYQPKGNLKALLQDPNLQLSFSKKVKIALGIAKGMSYLTTLADPSMQMHDNLKSNNVLIGRDWDVKIADYGHSNIRELARTMTSVGNVAWTAPEILSGTEATPKIATYAFGIILWELLTRQLPYKNEHPIRIVTRILSGYRPPIPSDCPVGYRQLTEQCQDGEPDMRPSWETIISILSAMDSN